MKKFFILFLNLICFSFLCVAQYTKKDFLDSLKNTVYLKDYFKKNIEYNDSSYAKYLNSFLPIDTFEIDSNNGFGFNPTSLSLSYQKSKYIKLYSGLGIKKGKKEKINTLFFYNYNGQKTALCWKFHENGNIEEIHYFKPELIDTAKNYGTLIPKLPSYRFKLFRKNGVMEITGNFSEGKKSGEWFYYNNKGLLFKKEKFNKNKRTSRVSF